MNSICFPLYVAADARFRLLTGHEKADFAFHFCALGAMNRREPGVIGPWPLTTLARKLGLPPKRVLKRLQTLSAAEVGLIEIEYDAPDEESGLSLLSSVRVEIVDFAEWNGLDEDEEEDEEEVDNSPSASNSNDSLGQNAKAMKQKRYRLRQIEKKKSELQKRLDQLNADIKTGEDAADNNSPRYPKGSRNGDAGVTQGNAGTGFTRLGDVTNGVTPSRAGDDNVQRNGLNLKINSNQENTLNVTNVGSVTPVTPSAAANRADASSPPPNLRGNYLAAQAIEFARELNDVGSEDRHQQLLAVCEEKGLSGLATEALRITKRAMARGRLTQPPGAYYQGVLTNKLAERNVHIPTKAELEAEPQSEVRRLAQESLAAAPGAEITLPPVPAPPKTSVITPLEDLYPGGDAEELLYAETEAEDE